MQATANDHETLRQLRRFIDENGYPPSVRELGAALGLSSPSPAVRRLKRLAELGWIERVADSPRALRIKEPQ